MANAGNATSSNCPSDSSNIKALKTLAYCSVMVTALLGNVAIVSLVLKTRELRKTINYFILNMAVSDFLQAIFVYPTAIVEVYWGQQRWLVEGKFGLALCKLDYFFVDISTAVSIQSLVLIAVDRFNAVVFPLRPPLFSSKVRLIVIACTWLAAVGLHFPYLLALRLFVLPVGTFCSFDWVATFGPSSSFAGNYYLALFVTMALIPFTLMTLLYLAIIVSLRRQNVPGQQAVNSSEVQRRHKRNKNVLKMAIAIVVGFALCWGPANVHSFLKFFVWEPDLGCVTTTFSFTAFFMAYSSGAVNPCVCFAFSGNYRSAFKSTFAGIMCKCTFLPYLRPFRHKSWTPRNNNGGSTTEP